MGHTRGINHPIQLVPIALKLCSVNVGFYRPIYSQLHPVFQYILLLRCKHLILSTCCIPLQGAHGVICIAKTHIGFK